MSIARVRFDKKDTASVVAAVAATLIQRAGGTLTFTFQELRFSGSIAVESDGDTFTVTALPGKSS